MSWTEREPITAALKAVINDLTPYQVVEMIEGGFNQKLENFRLMHGANHPDILHYAKKTFQEMIEMIEAKQAMISGDSAINDILKDE